MEPAYTEEELVEAAKTSRAAASELVVRYLRTAENAARSVVRRFPRASCEDLTQEALLALLDAVRSYDSSAGGTGGFRAYASVSMRNRMMTVLKRDSLQWSQVSENELDECIADTAPDPEAVVMEREAAEKLDRRIEGALSEREWQVFQLFLEGCSYREIALKLDIDVKSVNNALQRVRKKLRALV